MYPFTLEGLEQARGNLAVQIARRDNYSGNNPKKFDSDVSDARFMVVIIEEALKEAGILQKSEKELLIEYLDTFFAHARHNDIAEYNGKKYRRDFRPKFSNSRKSIVDWYRNWVEVDPDTPATVQPVAPKTPEQIAVEQAQIALEQRYWRGHVKLVRTIKAFTCPVCNSAIPARSDVLCLDGYNFLEHMKWGNWVKTFRLCEACTLMLRKADDRLSVLTRGELIFWKGDLVTILGISPHPMDVKY